MGYSTAWLQKLYKIFTLALKIYIKMYVSVVAKNVYQRTQKSYTNTMQKLITSPTSYASLAQERYRRG